MQRLLAVLLFSTLGACGSPSPRPSPTPATKTVAAEEGRYVVLSPTGVFRIGPGHPIGMRANLAPKSASAAANMDAEYALFERKGEEDGAVVVETLADAPEGHMCTRPAQGLEPFALRLFVDPRDLAEVTRKRVEVAYADGTSVELAAGVVLHPTTASAKPGETAFRVMVDRLPIVVRLASDAHATSFEMATPFVVPESNDRLNGPLRLADRVFPLDEIQENVGLAGVAGATRKGVTRFAIHTSCAVYHGLATLVERESVGELFGVGGLGLTGSSQTWKVPAGARVLARGGHVLGSTRVAVIFHDRAEDDGTRGCFRHPLGGEPSEQQGSMRNYLEICFDQGAIQ
ncbi:MAG: hypothetical protein IPJ34_02765 [Myxococcales bacterium]|nr:hypothetical protein [Myxococcales bacterium]